MNKRLTEDQYELAETFLRLCAAGICLLTRKEIRDSPLPLERPLKFAVQHGDELLRTVLTMTYEPKSKA